MQERHFRGGGGKDDNRNKKTEWSNEQQSILNVAAKSMNVLQKEKTIPDPAWNSRHPYLLLQTTLI